MRKTTKTILRYTPDEVATIVNNNGFFAGSPFQEGGEIRVISSIPLDELVDTVIKREYELYVDNISKVSYSKNNGLVITVVEEIDND